ncbi:MAG: hypothetical protein KME32_22595 [Mojavia pulchra JT2-VF2]|jgi:RecA/RadA recombinase|uniref:ATPase involved in DNA repair n=1 Tax=Mojavia pulchra JT2-VF2 TaxID=287848 RepID=A0A951Q2U7_9NOST|nr:hypothetical protein [Mojavia pulchra JT2-VF2]
MYRQKLTSRVLEKAELRIAGLKAIDPNIDFGGVCNLQNMTQLMETLRNSIDAYNTTLAMINSTRTEIEEMEKSLSSFSERMLLGVAFKYGKDSNEYMMAGGVRKSDRIRKSTATRLKSVAKAKSGKDVTTA